jgi:polyisoprenoid-binding protein YceI
LRRARRWIWWVGGAIALAALALVVGPFVYIHFIEDDPAPKLRLSDSPTSVAKRPASGDVSGTWNTSDGSTAQYRVNEVLFGQDNTATGKTSSVTGTVRIEGTTVREADISVDMTTFKSDEDRRDRQFQGRIMDTSQFPTSTFKLTQPIALGSVPVPGKKVTATATGELTMHGTTRTITTDLQAQRVGDKIEVVGQIPITFADYGIGNPSFAGITTEDHGTLEILLALAHG